MSAPNWAIGPHSDVLPWCEVRANADGTIDEIVTRKPVTVHIEQMDEGQYWIGLTSENGEVQHVMLTRNRKAIYPTVYQ